MQVRDLMSREVVTIKPTESYLDAVVQVQRARARHLPSCDPLWWSPWSCWPRPFRRRTVARLPGAVLSSGTRAAMAATSSERRARRSRLICPGSALKRDQAYLARWLRDPSLQRPTAHMPKIQLSETEVLALAAYLGSLR